jgi:hypothetical protein
LLRAAHFASHGPGNDLAERVDTTIIRVANKAAFIDVFPHLGLE